ncbi:chromosomal replication initiator DnaA [Pikeienuella piscinae]|uniref:Chromosomal replication initiator DnaA n=1 Tax=Pikeienuella piscinae TaxID=2748098 RepID=A0A7L5BTH1_9RHOB|nr:DnaA/Hda family protein [Pikeienuella piscinae]QIE54712.1 chromosomal replication initiator DnaA [Pikeienuella piscinae]
MSAQIPLGLALPKRPARGREAFRVSASNAAAVALIDRWRSWPNGLLTLTGPEGAGKTHLAHVWAGETGAERVAAATLDPADPPALVAAGAAAVEDADRIGGDARAEAALFHLINLARAEGAALLITGRGAPQSWPIRMPDLASRLAGAMSASLEPPDEALIADLLAKHFHDRGLQVDEGVLRFLGRRIERSAAAAAATVARLDEAALDAGRRITLPFVKEVTGL